MDGLHPDHFENSTHVPRDIASGSSSLERELGAAADVTDKVIDHNDDVIDVVTTPDVPVNGAVVDVTSPDVDTPEEAPVFVSDTYTDILGMQDVSTEGPACYRIQYMYLFVTEYNTCIIFGIIISWYRYQLPVQGFIYTKNCIL